MLRGVGSGSRGHSQGAAFLHEEPIRSCLSRELLGMLEDRLADLCLEYHSSPPAAKPAHTAPAERPQLLTAVNA